MDVNLFTKDRASQVFVVLFLFFSVALVTALIQPVSGSPGPTASTVAQGSDDCVIDDGTPGGAYPKHFSITCDGAAAGNGTFVTISMSGVWGYVAIVDLPDDAPDGLGRVEVNQAPTAPTDSMSRRQAYWETRLGSGDGRIAVVNGNGGLSYTDFSLDPSPVVFYRQGSFERTITLPPGTYGVELRAHPQVQAWTGTPSYSGHNVHVIKAPTTEAEMDEVIQTGQTKRSNVRLAVGNCDPNFSPDVRLPMLDRKRLEVLSGIADTRREFAEARTQFATGTAAITALFGGKVLTFAKTAVKGGIGQVVETLMGELGAGPNILSVSEIKSKMTDSAWARRSRLIREYRSQLKELRRLNEQYVGALETIDRCHGVRFQLPDSYEPISPADRQRAKADNGWP